LGFGLKVKFKLKVRFRNTLSQRLTNLAASVAGYFSSKDWDGPTHARAGLMPRWSRDGRFVAFDSAHIWGTGSQMYVAGVQQMKVGWPAAVPAARDPPARSALKTVILVQIPLQLG